ncbi:MAG: SAM-dependent methyltransferase, partial [Polyangia bacterium]
MPTTERSQGAGAARRIFVVTPGFEGALVAELGELEMLAARAPVTPPPLFSAQQPGLVNASDCGAAADRAIDPVFARQQLPDAHEVRGASVAALAEASYARVQEAVDLAVGAFTIHAFAPTGAEPGQASRAQLIAHELLARLQQRRRRAARLYRPAEAAAAAFGEVTLIIQVLLVARNRAWVSATTPGPLPRGGWMVSPWPGGIAPVVEDRLPPSRAYRKLEEAFLWMADEPQPGQWCVDLGGAPGGWTYTALQRGARVIAVDRAALEPPVRGHRALTMVEGNAFTYQPPLERVPVDWLLSDVICEPGRALDQLKRWLQNGWCRRV